MEQNLLVPSHLVVQHTMDPCMSPRMALILVTSSLTKHKFSDNHNDNNHRKEEERERENPTKTINAQHDCSPIPCSLMSSHCSRAAIGPLWTSAPSSYTGHGVLWCGICPWPVWVTSPSYAPSQLFVHLLAGRAQKAPWLRSSPAQPQPNHLSVTSIIPCCTSCREENEFLGMEVS